MDNIYIFRLKVFFNDQRCASICANVFPIFKMLVWGIIPDFTDGTINENCLQITVQTRCKGI